MNKNLWIVTVSLLIGISALIYWQNTNSDETKQAHVEPKTTSLNPNKPAQTHYLKNVDINEIQDKKRPNLESAKIEKQQSEQPQIKSDSKTIVTCPEMANEKEAEKQSNEFIDSLRDASTAQDELAYLLFSNSIKKENKVPSLVTFAKSHPMNKIALHEALMNCVEEPNIGACDVNWSQLINDNDRDNGSLWANLASFYAKRGELVNSEMAMEEAVKSPLFNSYSFDISKLYLDVTEAQIDTPFYNRSSIAVGFFAAKPTHLGELVKLCSDHKTQSLSLKNTCLALGQNIEQNSNTLLDKALGRAIQMKTYEAEANEEAVKKLKEKNDNLSFELGSDHGFDAMILSMFDENLFHSWMNNSIEHGESRAAKMLLEEAINLSADPFYNPCPKSQ